MAAPWLSGKSFSPAILLFSDLRRVCYSLAPPPRRYHHLLKGIQPRRVGKLRAQYYLPVKSYYLVAPIAQDDRGYYTLLPLFCISPFGFIIVLLLKNYKCFGFYFVSAVVLDFLRFHFVKQLQISYTCFSLQGGTLGSSFFRYKFEITSSRNLVLFLSHSLA